MSVLVLSSRVLLGESQSNWWVRWEFTSQMLASSIASGSTIALLGILGSGEPELNTSSLHTVLGVTIVVSVIWWQVEGQYLESRVLLSFPAAPPSDTVDGSRTRAIRRATRSVDRVTATARSRLRRSGRTTPRHVIFGAILLAAVGLVLLVIPTEGCRSVLWHLQVGSFFGGSCAETVRSRAWIALPLIALSVVACAGALLLPCAGNRRASSPRVHR